METSSVYMCFPCYQEFNTLEEVLTHQLTCTTENVAPPMVAPGTASVSLPLLQTQEQVHTLSIAPSTVSLIPQTQIQIQTQATVASVLPSSGAPLPATTSPRKPSSADQPRILYQCGDCDALFNALALWQHHRKEGQCQQNKSGPDPDPEPGPGPGPDESGVVAEEGGEDQAEVEVALSPDEANPPDQGGGERMEEGIVQDEVKDKRPVEKGQEECETTTENTTEETEEGVETQDDMTTATQSTPAETQSALQQDPTPSQPQTQTPSSTITTEPEDSYTPRRRGANKKPKPPSSLLCVDCGSSFGMVSELVSHRKTQHGLEEALHRCTVCGESFLNTTLFLYHRKQHRQRGEEREREGMMMMMGKDGAKQGGLKGLQRPNVELVQVQTSEDQVNKIQENPPSDGADGTSVACEEVVEESIAEMPEVAESQSNGPEEMNQDGTQDETTSTSTPSISNTQASTQSQSFLCAQCGSGFISEPELSAHRKDKHGLQEPLHRCSQCGEHFMNTTQYLYHRRQHRDTPGLGAGETVTEAGVATVPQESPHAPKRMLAFPSSSSTAASIAPPSKRGRPTIRIISKNALEESDIREVIPKEELEDSAVTPDLSDANTNLPPPAKLLQDWSRTPLPHVCPHCGKKFTRRVFLRAHVFSHTGEKLFTCKVCDKAFASSTNLLRHSLTHMGTKPFPCPVCGKRFSQAGTLKRHSLIHSQPKTRHRRSRLQVRMEEGEGANNLFACPNCTARFETEQQLTDHRLLHTSHPFPCSVCGEAFKRRKELDLHSLKHQDKQPAMCPHCSAQFLNQSVLDIHLQRCPESEAEKTVGRGRGQGRGRCTGQVECDMCGHRCMTQEGLDLHRLSHTGQTPLKCPLSPCRRRFASSSALGEHILAHCQGTQGKGRQARRFHCQICGKDFAYTSTFNVHMRIHTDERPFECSTCGKRFRQLPHLQDHERIHSGLRPFCCWVCGKSFSVAARLTEHARVHSGEKPYPCPRCPASFRSRSNLDKHIRIHGDDPGDAFATAITDAEMTEGARVLTTLATGGEGESAVQTILLVQSDGGTEGMMVPGMPVSEHTTGAFITGAAGSQVVFLHPSLGAQTISMPSMSVPSITAMVEGQEMPSVTVVEGQDVPHTIEFIIEETV